MQAYWDTSGLSQLKLLSNGTEEQQAQAAKAAAQQFESILIAEMLKAARSNPFSDEESMNSSAMQSIQGMFDQQVAHSVAGKGIGLAQYIEKSITDSLKWTRQAEQKTPE